jgi:hypothetical protein
VRHKPLLDKASSASDAAQAVNFAQAACNAANALRVLTEIDRGVLGSQELYFFQVKESTNCLSDGFDAGRDR